MRPDLCFVAVCSYLGQTLESDWGARTLFGFGVLFVSVWRVWENTNIYVNRFHPRDAVHKIYFFVEMTAVMGIAVFTVFGVSICYLFGRGLTELMTLMASGFDKRARPRALAESCLFAISSVPWIVSIFLDNNTGVVSAGHRETPDTLHLALWTAGLSLEIVGLFVIRLLPLVSLPGTVRFS